jgi:uncharacterized protein
LSNSGDDGLDDDADLSLLNDRTCIVTRAAQDRTRLIRFVAAPDGAVTPDLKAVLPGRGCWVTASRETLQLAIKRKLFARALKAEVVVPPDLPEMVERLLERNALGVLGLLRKSGHVFTGAAKVEDLVRNGRAAFTVHATDGAPDGIRKIDQARRACVAMDGPDISAFRLFASAELSLALGGENVIHVAASAGGAANAARDRLALLAMYRGAQDGQGGEVALP